MTFTANENCVHKCKCMCMYVLFNSCITKRGNWQTQSTEEKKIAFCFVFVDFIIFIKNQKF